MPPNALMRVKIVQSYDAEETNELSISDGDELFVYRKNNESGWWLGEIIAGANKGKKGWFPQDFAVEM